MHGYLNEPASWLGADIEGDLVFFAAFAEH